MDFGKACLLKLWNSNESLLRGMVTRSSTNSLVQKVSSLTPAQRKAQNRWPWHRILLHAYLIQCVIRFLFAAYVLKTGRFTYIQDWNTIMAISVKVKLIDFNAALCCAPLTLMITQFDYVVNVKRFNNVIRLAYDALVINRMHFLKLNPQFKPRLSWEEPIDSLKSIWKIIGKFLKPSASEKIRWAAPRLRYFPNLDEKIRLKSVLLNWAYQICISLFLIGTILVIIAGFLYYTFFFLLPNVDSFPKYLIGQLDLIIICLVAFHTIRLFCFFSALFFAVEFYYHNHRLSFVKEAVILREDVRRGRLPQSRLLEGIPFLLGEHLTAWHHAQAADKYLVSPLFFYGTISMFSLNVWMVTSLYFSPLSTADKVMLYCLLVLQCLFYLIICQPIILLTKDVNEPGKVVGTTQLYLNRCTSARHLLTKLKIMAYFEQAHSLKPFYFTFGAFGQVTNMAIFEFLLFYSGHLMFMFSTISEQNRSEK